jgi:hypothetical protein
VHGSEPPNYEELNQKEKDLNSIRQNLSELNTRISGKRSSQEESKEPRPSNATQSDLN